MNQDLFYFFTRFMSNSQRENLFTDYCTSLLLVEQQKFINKMNTNIHKILTTQVSMLQIRYVFLLFTEKIFFQISFPTVNPDSVLHFNYSQLLFAQTHRENEKKKKKITGKQKQKQILSFGERESGL